MDQKIPRIKDKCNTHYPKHNKFQNIEELKKELMATRKTLGEYIKMMGFEVNDEVIDREIIFYGKDG